MLPGSFTPLEPRLVWQFSPCFLRHETDDTVFFHTSPAVCCGGCNCGKPNLWIENWYGAQLKRWNAGFVAWVLILQFSPSLSLLFYMHSLFLKPFFACKWAKETDSWQCLCSFATIDLAFDIWCDTCHVTCDIWSSNILDMWCIYIYDMWNVICELSYQYIYINVVMPPNRSIFIVTALHWNTSAAFNLPVDPASCLCEERMRGNWIATSLVALAHGIPFFHAGGLATWLRPQNGYSTYCLYEDSLILLTVCSQLWLFLINAYMFLPFAHLCLYELIMALYDCVLHASSYSFIYCFHHCSLQKLF